MAGLQTLWIQVSVACLLLETTFDPAGAQLLLKPPGCPTCREGYFVVKNCSLGGAVSEGIRCRLCTDCSASRQETLLRCSTFADSLCGGGVTPAAPPVSAPEVWIVFTLIFVSVFLVLLSLFLLSCRHHHGDGLKGLDLLWLRRIRSTDEVTPSAV